MADTAVVDQQQALDAIDRRIRELERVRAVKTVGSWLYELDTGQIERLRAERKRLRAGRAMFEQCA